MRCEVAALRKDNERLRRALSSEVGAGRLESRIVELEQQLRTLKAARSNDARHRFGDRSERCVRPASPRRRGQQYPCCKYCVSASLRSPPGLVFWRRGGELGLVSTGVARRRRASLRVIGVPLVLEPWRRERQRPEPRLQDQRHSARRSRRHATLRTDGLRRPEPIVPKGRRKNKSLYANVIELC